MCASRPLLSALRASDANTESVGAALAEANIPRDQLFITDKLSKGIKDVRGTLVASLKSASISGFRADQAEMGLDYVDLFLIHDPTAPENVGISQAEAWRQMEEVQQAGLTKAIGVSNYRVKHLQCAEFLWPG